MSRMSVSTSLEAKILETLRGLQVAVPCVGLMEVADAGTLKEEDLTSLQVRVFNFAQLTENGGTFTVEAEVRLNVEAAESANGAAFFDAHEKVALWLEHVMLDANCAELDTAEAYVDGLQRTGGDKDFDTTGETWFALWNMTLSGRIKPTQQEATGNGQ